jgi:hypothetical protein
MSRFDDNNARAVQGTVGRYGSFISRPGVSCPVKALDRIERVALSDDDARALRRFQRLLVTLAVLVLGTLVEAFHQSFGNVERASVFLVFYLPLFMLGPRGVARGRWMPSWHAARDGLREAHPMTRGVSRCRYAAC